MSPTDSITIIATVVNAGSVVVLAFITYRYAEITRQILEESRRSREAAEKQAIAARENVELLERQLEEQSGLGRKMVQNAIDSGLFSISYWRSLPLSDLSRASSLPDPNDLLPANHSVVLEHARRISASVSQLVLEDFENLRMAKNEIERTKNANAAIKTGFYNDKPSQADAYLVVTSHKFQEAQQAIDHLP